MYSHLVESLKLLSLSSPFPSTTCIKPPFPGLLCFPAPWSQLLWSLHVAAAPSVSEHLLFHSPLSAAAGKGGWESPKGIAPKVKGSMNPRLARGKTTTKSRSSGKGNISLSSSLAHPPSSIMIHKLMCHSPPAQLFSRQASSIPCRLWGSLGCGATNSQVFWDGLGWMAMTEVTKG